MKTANFPRSVIMGVAGKSFPFPVNENDWLISITDSGCADATVEKNFNRVLFLKFADTGTVGCGEISDAQAEQVANFIKSALDLQKNVWVNCHAGISRSGAIAALLGDLGWEIVTHPESPQRIPNVLVYNKVRKHFPQLSQSWD